MIKIFATFGALFELQEAELRNATRLVEAAATDRFQTDLRLVVDTEEGREKVREAALELAKLGISGWEEIEEMVRTYRYAQMFDLTASDIRAIGQVRMRGWQSGSGSGTE